MGSHVFLEILLLATMAAMTTQKNEPVNTDSLRMPQRTQLCRDRLGYFPRDIFTVSSCSLCYFYLIVDSPKFRLNSKIHYQDLHLEPLYLVSNNLSIQHVQSIYPTVENYTTFNDVCATLSDVKCKQWITCCQSANQCCEQQQQRKNNRLRDSEQFCPETFDGWACWNATPPGMTAVQNCPSFLHMTNLSPATSRKMCGESGAWMLDNSTGLEITDYTACSKGGEQQLYRVTSLLAIALSGAGTILLTISLYMFTSHRTLRRQLRIKVHVNLFVSLLLMHLLSLVWESAVRLDRLDHPGNQSFLHVKQGLCKSLRVLHMCSRACVFFWMTSEGFLLHRLLGNAFTPPIRVHGYMLFGWGVPLMLYTVYAVLRKVLADDDLCWLKPLTGSRRIMDWGLVFAPTIVCILANCIFLINIVKLLSCQMVSHNQEPSNFRKALRATGMLVPLFGLQQFCLIYRPSPDLGTPYHVYEIASAVILNSQGIIISIVYCFLNTEVRSHARCPCFAILSSATSQTSFLHRRKSSLSSLAGSRRTSVSSLQHVVNNQSRSTEPGQSLSANNGQRANGFEQSTEL